MTKLEFPKDQSYIFMALTHAYNGYDCMKLEKAGSI